METKRFRRALAAVATYPKRSAGSQAMLAHCSISTIYKARKCVAEGGGLTPAVEHAPEVTATTAATAEFDKTIQTISQTRGDVYGHPKDDFERATLIKHAVADCPNDAIRHALEMIGVKMARLTTTPTHVDSVIDIAGYARTIVMIIDKEAE